MTFPVARATKHLQTVAKQADISIVWADSQRAESFPDARVIIPKPKNGYLYLIALHELGHCLSSGARLWSTNEDIYGEVACEGFAWAWAAAYRDKTIPIRSSDRKRAAVLFASYW